MNRCDSCGSHKTMECLNAEGFVSCCPERKMDWSICSNSAHIDEVEQLDGTVTCATCGHTPFPTFDSRNARVQKRYDELMRQGKHGHYETLFRVVREEVDRVLEHEYLDRGNHYACKFCGHSIARLPEADAARNANLTS